MRIKETKIYNYLRSYIVQFRIYKYHYYDAKRYIKYSNSINYDGSKNKILSTIEITSHVIEKGLTMPKVRLGFGQKNILFLINKCNYFIDKYNSSDSQILHAIGVLVEYQKYHQKSKFELPSGLMDKISIIADKVPNFMKAEQKQIGKDRFSAIRDCNFNVFASSRFSLRNYDSREIPIETIFNAIEMAQTSPSSCNRQPARVHIYSNQNKINEILALQNGNRGFGHLSNKLLIITVDLSGYKTHKERTMFWVDGGIYLLNLIYSLQYHEIGSCILNWGVDKKDDTKLRNISNIPNNESIIALVTCGYVPNNCSAVLSPKKYYAETSIHHK